jgi:nuclear pore complex protein Nup85
VPVERSVPTGRTKCCSGFLWALVPIPSQPDLIPAGRNLQRVMIGPWSTEDEASRIRAGDIVGVLKEVNQCCFEHGREGVRRMVCRVSITQKQISPRAFSRNSRRSLAKRSWMRNSTDSPSRTTPPLRTGPGWDESSTKSYTSTLAQGPTKFTSLVAEIAPSLQTLRSAADVSDYPMHGIFLHRLMFIVKYAEFHQRKMSNDLVEAAADLISMFEDDIAPTSWWGVLLQDSVEFLNYRECYSVPDPARLSPFWISRWHAFYISEHRAVAS